MICTVLKGCVTVWNLEHMAKHISWCYPKCFLVYRKRDSESGKLFTLLPGQGDTQNFNSMVDSAPLVPQLAHYTLYHTLPTLPSPSPPPRTFSAGHMLVRWLPDDLQSLHWLPNLISKIV